MQREVISKMEKHIFRYRGLSVHELEDGIKIFIEDYVNSLDNVFLPSKYGTFSSTT